MKYYPIIDKLHEIDNRINEEIKSKIKNKNHDFTLCATFVISRICEGNVGMNLGKVYWS